MLCTQGRGYGCGIIKKFIDFKSKKPIEKINSLKFQKEARNLLKELDIKSYYIEKYNLSISSLYFSMTPMNNNKLLIMFY